MHRAIGTIKLKYWWPSNAADITSYVQSCQSCRYQKTHRQIAPLPIQKYRVSTHPFEEAHIDLTGPFPCTIRGNVYILVAKCPLAKAIELIAIPSKEAIDVARALIDHVYYRHGCTRIVYSDQGCNEP